MAPTSRSPKMSTSLLPSSSRLAQPNTLAMAVPIYCVNLLLDTNFMFLMYAPDGNSLAWFRDRFGHHWIGFPVLLAAVFALMDVPVLLKGRQENKAIRAAE